MKHLIELDTEELLALAQALSTVAFQPSLPYNLQALIQAVAKVDREATDWLYDQRVSRGGWIDPVLSARVAKQVDVQASMMDDAVIALLNAHPSL